MHTLCYSPTRQGSYASALSQQSPVTAGSCQVESFKSSKTTNLPFKNSSKISKPKRQPRKTHLKILGLLSSHTTLAAHEAAVLASPFLSLPGEIRNMIYTYALASDTKEIVYDKRNGRFDVSGIAAGLLQTCHMVARETMYMPLLLNTLVFGSTKTGGEPEQRMLKCIGRIIMLGREFGWRDKLKVKVSRLEMEYLDSKQHS